MSFGRVMLNVYFASAWDDVFLYCVNMADCVLNVT